MTCREKLAIEHPDCVDDDSLGGCIGCPHYYGYLDYPESCRPISEENCRRCWDREIPDENVLATETEFEKENNMATTKKTKAELEKELESVKATKAELEKELKNLEKYKQYENMADEIHAIYISFVNAGFSNEQAYDLIKTAMLCANQINLNTTIKPVNLNFPIKTGYNDRRC